MNSKKKMLELYQITLENGWYWQKKENMSPWKVFSENHFNERSFLWLLFRVHKFCLAKYLYFSSNLDIWQPVFFEPERMIIPKIITDEDWVKAEAFMCKKTKRFITIPKLQQIRDKQVFIDWIEAITGKKIEM